MAGICYGLRCGLWAVHTWLVDLKIWILSGDKFGACDIYLHVSYLNNYFKENDGCIS